GVVGEPTVQAIPERGVCGHAAASLESRPAHAHCRRDRARAGAGSAFRGAKSARRWRPPGNHRTPRSDPLTRVSGDKSTRRRRVLSPGDGRELTSATSKIRRNRPNFRRSISLLGWGTAVAYDFLHVSNDTRIFNRTAKLSGGVGLHAP